MVPEQSEGQLPQLNVPPQPSDALPHVLPKLEQVLGVQVYPQSGLFGVVAPEGTQYPGPQVRVLRVVPEQS